MCLGHRNPISTYPWKTRDGLEAPPMTGSLSTDPYFSCGWKSHLNHAPAGDVVSTHLASFFLCWKINFPMNVAAFNGGPIPGRAGPPHSAGWSIVQQSVFASSGTFRWSAQLSSLPLRFHILASECISKPSLLICKHSK